LCESAVITVWQHIAECMDNGERIEGGILCDSPVITVWQHIADCMDNGERIDGIIIKFSKDFYLVLHELLLTKILISGVDSSLVAWVRDFLLDSLQRVSLG
jgi:hypothetical protein